jgi:hypothetical protein
MGRCDRASGVCKCRDGYSGPACDIRDCYRDKNCKIYTKRCIALCRCGSAGSVTTRTVVRCLPPAMLTVFPYIPIFSTDISCSGHGTCVSTATLFELFGLSYGNVTTDYIKAGGPTWDAYRWHHCLCSANMAAGFLGDPLRPSVGPR